MEGIKDAAKEYASEGASINNELFYLHPSIQGVFDSLDHFSLVLPRN